MHQYRDAMSRALFLANRAATAGDVPVGAVVLDPLGKIIGEGWNVREANHDPSGHAEIIALREAGQYLKRWNLVGCTLVVTLEPCTMCAGAAVSSRVDRVVFGAWEPKTGAAGSLRDVLRDSRMGHNIEVIPGVLASEASAQLRAFFDECRQREALKDRIPPASPMPDFISWTQRRAGADQSDSVNVDRSSVHSALSEFAEIAASVKIPVVEDVVFDEEAAERFGSLPRLPQLGERPRYRSLSEEELLKLDEERRSREALEGSHFELPPLGRGEADSSESELAGDSRLAGLPEDLQSIIAGIAVRKQRMQ